MKRQSLLCRALVVVTIFLGACTMPAPETPTPVDAHVLFTSAAQTADAKRALQLLFTDTPQPPPTDTPTPSPVPASATPTGPVQATVVLSTADDSQPVEDKAEFVEDVTVPDGEAHGPNRPFIKTWRIRNVGPTTWTTDYAIVFVDGELMSAPAEVPLTREVAPGESIDISVRLIAPVEPGIFNGLWKLRNSRGQLFGVGASGRDPIWVIISVVAGAGAGTPTAGAVSGQVVTEALITADPVSYSGICPKTIFFTVQFTISKSATVTYSLQAGNDTGMEIKLPPPATQNLEAGTHTMIYELTFNNSLNGWMRVRFLEPEEVVSPQVDFTISCLN